MSGAQDELARQIDADNDPVIRGVATDPGFIRAGERQLLRQREEQGAALDQRRTGPPLAYQATGGADWQSGDGWRYKPLNKAAVAQQMVRLASSLQDTANATAAFGMGRGRYPEWSDEMASLARRMRVWAQTMDTDAADAAETEA